MPKLDDSLRTGLAPRSVSRVLSVLDALTRAAHGETLSALSNAVGVPKTSLHNLMSGLLAEGYVIQDGVFFKLGPHAFGLANAIVATQGQPGFPALTRPFLNKLSEQIDETVMLAVLNEERDAAIYIEVIEAAHSIRFSIPLGSQWPLYSTASGRVLLAFQTSEQIDAYLDTQKLRKLSEFTITNKKLLRATLTKVRADLLCAVKGEAERDVFGFAAPIFDARGEVIAAVVAAGPTPRAEAKLETISKAVQSAGADISRAFGYRLRDFQRRPRRRKL